MFLNFFLPDLDTSRKVSEAFKSNGIVACFHYYVNNWHYVRKWQHLKDVNSLNPVSNEVKTELSKLRDKTFEQSDKYIAKNISCLIKLSWTEEEVRDRAQKMFNLIKENI